MRVTAVPAAMGAPSPAARPPFAARRLRGELAKLGFAVVDGTDVAFLAGINRRVIIRFERDSRGRVAYRDTLAKAKAVRAAHDLGIALHRATLTAGLHQPSLH